MLNKDKKYIVIDEIDEEPVPAMMQYIIDNFDAITYIKFDEEMIKKDEPSGEIEIYMKHGEDHRLDGPSTKYADGTVDYYIEGEYKSWSFWNDPRVKEKTRKDRKEKLRRINKKSSES